MNPNPEDTQSSFPGGPQEDRSYSMVILSGLVTTVITLGAIHFLSRNTDFNIMGWYANYVLPIGAFIVGVASAIGYGVASWLTGVKITRNLFWMVLGLQLIAYFVAQYIEFRDLMHTLGHAGSVSFFRYYDFMAQHFAWKQSDGTMGQPLGMWGYCFRGLEILGFVFGGLIVPMVLRRQPYCASCQLYMKSRRLPWLAASVPLRKVKKKDQSVQAAYAQEQQQALEAGKSTITTLQELATGNKTADFQKQLETLRPGSKAVVRLPGRFSQELVFCKRCHTGQYVVKLVVGQGKQIRRTEFARTQLHPEFVRAVVQ